MVTLYIFYSNKSTFWTTLFIFVADSPSAHKYLLFPHLESTAGGMTHFLPLLDPYPSPPQWEVSRSEV